MVEWTQQGFAVIADSNMGGPPLVASFRPSEAMAQADLKRNQVSGMEGTIMAKVLASLRVVPATMIFDDGKPD